MEKRVYFKNLNALRFFAAVAVIFHHIEQYKFWAHLPSAWGTASVDALGHKAVSFFFVLSGFLITYLLLEEHKRTDDINVRSFYVRRILRIWPLYYLIVFICLFFLPGFFDTLNLGGDYFARNFVIVGILLLLVLPNVVRTFVPNVAGGNQLWSIGVEEQFYFVWPVLVKRFIKNLLTFLIGFVLLKIVVTLVLDFLVASYDVLIIDKLARIWILLQVEQMAIGAIGAWLLFHQKKAALSFIYRPLVFTISCFAVALLFIFKVEHWWIHYAEAVVFAILIMNLSTNPAITFSMENKVLNALGNVSYGIYMYHTVCITVCLLTLKYFSVDQYDHTLFNVILYTASVVMTIAISYLSYEMFEKRFLEFKEKFMVVKSGAQANQSAEKAQWTFMRLVPQWLLLMYRRYRF